MHSYRLRCFWQPGSTTQRSNHGQSFGRPPSTRYKFMGTFVETIIANVDGWLPSAAVLTTGKSSWVLQWNQLVRSDTLLCLFHSATPAIIFRQKRSVNNLTMKAKYEFSKFRGQCVGNGRHLFSIRVMFFKGHLFMCVWLCHFYVYLLRKVQIVCPCQSHALQKVSVCKHTILDISHL